MDEYETKLVEVFERFFPKGDKRRQDALVLVAYGIILLDKLKNDIEEAKTK